MPRDAQHNLPASPIRLVIDWLENGWAKGWAHDGSRGDDDTAVLTLLVDGQPCAQAVCDDMREDVRSAGYGSGRAGFRVRLPRACLDGEPHVLTVQDESGLPVSGLYEGIETAEMPFTSVWRPDFKSNVDGLRGGAVEGWLLQRSHETDELVGGGMIRVTCEGATIGHTRASRMRADVGKALNGAADCGFRFKLPETVRRGRPQEFRFFLMPGNIELSGSPLTVTLVSSDTEAQILEMSEMVDGLHRELTRLRGRMRQVLSAQDTEVADYDDWYAPYAEALRARVLATREPGAAQPLVSVICPVFRPELAEFRAAVESVLGQTYANWELILADDASNDAALTRCLKGFAAADPRIKLVTLPKNGGISRSTNAALEAASGEWIAFFDHDDLLADTALEVMVRAAQQSGGTVLYSDEDKVDASGNYSMPAFKPDWNHRLMLGVNYVCHLLFVHKDVVRAAGALDSRYDGAQDHDFILRLSEQVPPEAIVHVPEILYHWRITAKSTAGSVEAKPYAIDAGIGAVQAHLNRLGWPARVGSIMRHTLYRQDWLLEREPSVEIVIPFKDEIETTRRCVRTLLSVTGYKNFTIRLVDNWSTSDAAVGFAAEMAREPKVTVMRVEEGFNYSRLNNLAIRAGSAEFVVLMNNDVFVTAPGWLRAAVGEAVADPAVGIVGGHFVYPSGLTQHAGVILGLGGVAGHVGVGLPEGDNGYGGRLLFAQEYVAVTAAGMLLRRAAFDAVGGLDERNLVVAFNDVDLCLRVRAAGYKVVWTPDFAAEHHESLSRGDDVRPAQEKRFFHESEHMKAVHGALLTRDPFYNKNLSLDRSPFQCMLLPEQAAARDWIELRTPPRPLVTESWRPRQPAPPAPPRKAAAMAAPAPARAGKRVPKARAAR